MIAECHNGAVAEGDIRLNEVVALGGAPGASRALTLLADSCTLRHAGLEGVSLEGQCTRRTPCAPPVARLGYTLQGVVPSNGLLNVENAPLQL